MIRKMRREDMSTVLDIWLAGNLQAHPFIPQEYWQSHLEKMERDYLPAADVFVYADEEGQPIKSFMGIVNESYIAGIFVLPQFQGQGIGKALLAYGKEAYAMLSLHVYCQNTRAIDFYEGQGFSTSDYGIDEETGEQEQTMIWRK